MSEELQAVALGTLMMFITTLIGAFAGLPLPDLLLIGGLCIALDAGTAYLALTEE